MRKQRIEKILEILHVFIETHDEIKKNLDEKKNTLAIDLLVMCQKTAIEIGQLIESSEGEDFITVKFLEEYCETVFNMHKEILNSSNSNSDKIYKNLNISLHKIENSINQDITIRREAVFLPYKASMWDSLESIWKAADADPDCDTYVIPIPYFDKNADGSLNSMHYEGDLYPDDVPITQYNEFDFLSHRPDMIFIHYPYDNANYVTTIDPFFYSDKIKKYTDCLVYVPYYATAGGMSEGQELCPAYINADYIVIQSVKYKDFFDKRIPENKFLPFGSPKFDSVLKKCQKPPEPPEEWKKKMEGRKVYFYNTSIAGMLEHTENFLKKMEFVFQTFKDREDACLLWRPHPLLESTFASMRNQYKPFYDRLKKNFIEEKIGIYDTTPNLENTIALSDVYLGDSSSSVVSLFGVAGKPLFIINHGLYENPKENDWKATVYMAPRGNGQNKYCILPGNKLYYSPNNDFHFEYYCDLSGYAGGGYYSDIIEHEGKIYVTPANAEHILVIEKNKQMRRIELKHETENPGAFQGSWYWKDKLFLLPNLYSALVILDLSTEEITYITGVSNFNVGYINGERVAAAKWIWRNKLYVLNFAGTKLLVVDNTTFHSEIKDVPFGRIIVSETTKELDYETVWLIPYSGTVIINWNIETGQYQEYDVKVEGLTSIHRRHKQECDIKILGTIAFVKDKLIISPNWGNKFVELDLNTGLVKEWKPPFEISTEDKSVYYSNWGMGYFIKDLYKPIYRYFYAPQRKSYDINLETKEAKELEIVFDKHEVFSHASGFSKWSQWTQYICAEDVFNTLEDLLNNEIHGNKFHREKQEQAYANINANVNGDCGEKIYRYVLGSK